MEEEEATSRALSSIAKSSVLIISGVALSTIISFFSKIVIARFYDISEYGVYGITFTIVNIAVMVSLLGLHSYVPREIASSKILDGRRLGSIISTSILIATASSLTFFSATFLLSEKLALIFGSDPRVGYALRIVVVALPTIVIRKILVAFSRGLGRSREAFLYEYSIYYIIFFVLVSIGGFLRKPLSYIFVSYTISCIVTFLLLLFDSFRLRIVAWSRPSSMLARELLRYSVPLLLVGILGMILTWTDTLMLGYFYGTKIVGYYKVASPIARSLPFFLTAVIYMYLPTATQLYSMSQIRELKRVYQVLSKWVFLLTFPIFLLVFAYPRATIGFLFGSKYIPSAIPLQILVAGFMFRTTIGLSGTSLVVIKDNNFLLVTTGIAGALNILLNYMLIPPYGMVGAAVATAASYSLASILNQLRLYRRTGIHPFTMAYMKPLIISSLLTAVLWLSGISAPTIWRAILILLIFLLSYTILIVTSKSIEKEDLELLKKISRRIGLKIDRILLILERFVA